MAKKGTIIGVSLGLAALATLVILATVEAAPPEGYVCPYCGQTFATFEELVAHVQTEHPGERIPLEIEWE